MEHISKSDLKKLEKMLNEEKELLEGDGELKGVAIRNPDLKGDWVPFTVEKESGEEEVYNEALVTNAGITETLETRYQAVLYALSNIKKGGYGTCEVSGKPIEIERLFANAAARTNIANREIELPSEA